MKKLHFICIGILLIISGFSFAETTGKLAGNVQDRDGSPIPYADIIIIGTDIGTQTNDMGQYIIINIPPGIYDVQVTGAGFQKAVIEGVIIKLDDTTIQNATLSKATIELEGTTVTATRSELVSRNKTSGGNSINIDKIEDMKVMAGGFSSIRTENWNTEEYGTIVDNEYKKVLDTPLSTFSIDVDAASYANTRRFINMGQFPYHGAVRIEELINYFDYDYPQPTDEDPFSVYTEISDCPWNETCKLMHIGLQGKDLDLSETPQSNLVFLLDVSGSMDSYNKLGLVKKAFKLLVENLKPMDRVSIVVYAGAAGLVLPPTNGEHKDVILEAIDRLSAGGSTAGGEGIKLAYKTARDNFIVEGNNRVILATDGDFNIGISDTSELIKYLEEERENGIFLTTLGFGMRNYKDGRLEQLADKGNGNYYYIDNILEAKKVFVRDLNGTLFTIAKDVKLQLEFNPVTIYAYRLIGYENRLLNKEDFNDDKKDAGELGAGHTVTALYELILQNDIIDVELPEVDKLKYQTKTVTNTAKQSNEILTLKFRYKQPDGNESKLLEFPINNNLVEIDKSSDNFRFSAAVAGFGQLLRDSKFKGNVTYETLIDLAKSSKGTDEFGYRAEFIQLLEKAELIEVEE